MQFSLLDNHVILQIDSVRALLDTGAPRSFGRVASLRLPWRATADTIVPTDPAGRSIELVGRAIRSLGHDETRNLELDLLLGCDLLAGCRLRFDWNLHELTIVPRTDHDSVRAIHGYPVRHIDINDHRVEAVLDTGARISYVRPWLVADEAASIGTAVDFNLLQGQHEENALELFVCDVVFGGHGRQLPMARAGTTVDTALVQLGVDAIVGVDLMSDSGPTTIDLP